jgi:hypothetical protein
VSENDRRTVLTRRGTQSVPPGLLDVGGTSTVPFGLSPRVESETLSAMAGIRNSTGVERTAKAGTMGGWSGVVPPSRVGLVVDFGAAP